MKQLSIKILLLLVVVRLQAAPLPKRPAAKHFSKNSFSFSGKWRAVFQIRPDVEVPVNFEITGATADDAKLFFLNAEEHFEGGKVVLSGDSLFVSLNQFDNEFAFKVEGKTLKGVLRRQDRRGTPLPVTAEQGINYRFTEATNKPAGNISGTYDVVFSSGNGKEEKAVGLFSQTGNKLRGTFLRVTGDARYLEGIVDGNNFYLSSFIGSSPSFYKGTFTADGKLSGESVGARGGQPFTAVADKEAALPDPYSLTYLKSGYNSFDFSFPDINGKLVSLKDEKYKNKVVIVAIGGTWCPNCIDEAAFLSPWYKQNRKRGVEIISIQYERQTDTAFTRKSLGRFKERFNIDYDQVVGGVADKQQVATSLPALNTFLAFPTTILINKKGEVVKIHTGYSGPATGKYYDAFVKEFNEDINALLKL